MTTDMFILSYIHNLFLLSTFMTYHLRIMNSMTGATSGEGEETAYTTTRESVFTPGNSVAQSLVFYAAFLPFLGHYIVIPSSINGFCLPLVYSNFSQKSINCLQWSLKMSIININCIQWSLKVSIININCLQWSLKVSIININCLQWSLKVSIININSIQWSLKVSIININCLQWSLKVSIINRLFYSVDIVGLIILLIFRN